MEKKRDLHHRLTTGSMLITLGIVFGDIGTSPLYVFSAITGGVHFDPVLIYGGLSCIFWTLMIISTFKYIYLALDNDNHGEGGIFSLYALLRKTKRSWIVYPALIGCATLVSDGFITPAISISSAVEGLATLSPGFPVLPVVCLIVVSLFLVQQFGTNILGKFFGPIMLIWFLTMGLLGLNQIVQHPSILKALSPIHAFDLLVNYPGGFWILGAVFLCTTGAEALFSDLGHCGKKNIRFTWVFVIAMLLLNYSGQAAFCLAQEPGVKLASIFYATVPEQFLIYVILIATLATVIASQALITGIYTLVNEAIKLRLWANLRVKYPSEHKGQVYIPFINYFLLAGCLAVILLFKKSANMESAYGLAITIDMLMTTLLLAYLIWIKHQTPRSFSAIAISIIVVIEFSFLISNISKITHGGWFTLVLSFLIFFLLLLHYRARLLRKRVAEYRNIKSILPVLEAVRQDETIPPLSNNLVYPTRSGNIGRLDSTIIHSLFSSKPKRASKYWFLHITITDAPWGVEYVIHPLIPKHAFFVKLSLGFKEPHLVENFMKKIHGQLVSSGEIDQNNIWPSLSKYDWPPDFRFVIISSRVASDNKLTHWDMLAIKVYRFIKSVSLSSIDDFGLDKTTAEIEFIPVNVRESLEIPVARKKS